MFCHFISRFFIITTCKSEYDSETDGQKCPCGSNDTLANGTVTCALSSYTNWAGNLELEIPPQRPRRVDLFLSCFSLVHSTVTRHTVLSVARQQCHVQQQYGLVSEDSSNRSSRCRRNRRHADTPFLSPLRPSIVVFLPPFGRQSYRPPFCRHQVKAPYAAGFYETCQYLQGQRDPLSSSFRSIHHLTSSHSSHLSHPFGWGGGGVLRERLADSGPESRASVRQKPASGLVWFGTGRRRSSVRPVSGIFF